MAQKNTVGRYQGAFVTSSGALKTGNDKLLVATDVLSYGIDISEPTHVINFSLPQEKDDYICHICRTARAYPVSYIG